MAGAVSLSPSFSLYKTSTSPSARCWHPSRGVWLEKASSSFRCNAKKKLSFVDQILDYIEGGPKLRKWYGAPDPLTKDDESKTEDDDMDAEGEEDRDVVLVSDGDSEMGQMVILSLIVKRLRVKALVKDKRAALEAFGNYVESLAGDSDDKLFIKKALRGVRAVICTNEGFLSKVDTLKGLQHIILLSKLSVYEGTSGIISIMNSTAKRLVEQDESILINSGIPYTIIRVGSLQNSPGGSQGFSFKEGSASTGTLSKEDAAFICVQALDSVPTGGLKFEVINGDEKVSDWKQKFMALMGVAD